MKKKIALLFFTAFVLFGCSKKQDEWDKLHQEMSASEVEEIVGKPQKILTDSNEIVINAYSEYKTITDIRNFKIIKDMQNGDFYSDKYINEEEESEILSEILAASVDSDTNVSQYVYSIKDSDRKKSKKNIYFISGSAYYISGQTKDEDDEEENRE